MDWPGLMAAGLRGLGLKPHEFWRLTPGELMLMLGPADAQAPLNRAGLEALVAAYPDRNKDRLDD